MASLNRIILVGRLSADPEIRSTLDNIPIANFSIAVDRRTFVAGPKQTDFIDVIAWRNLADTCGKYLKKGCMVLVEGRIQTRSYETKDGIRKYVTEVVAKDVVFLDNSLAKSENGLPGNMEEPREALESVSAKEDAEFLDENLPF